MENKKLTEEELSNIKDLNKRLYDSLIAIGDMEASIDTLTLKKKIALDEHKKTVSAMSQVQADLGKKYDSTRVDMATGVLS
jgi:hypothetical protein